MCNSTEDCRGPDRAAVTPEWGVSAWRGRPLEASVKLAQARVLTIEVLTMPTWTFDWAVTALVCPLLPGMVASR